MKTTTIMQATMAPITPPMNRKIIH